MRIVWLQLVPSKQATLLRTLPILVYSREHAAAHIAVLVEADRRGHYSHGFNRLRGHYVADIRSQVRY